MRKQSNPGKSRCSGKIEKTEREHHWRSKIGEMFDKERKVEERETVLNGRKKQNWRSLLMGGKQRCIIGKQKPTHSGQLNEEIGHNRQRGGGHLGSDDPHEIHRKRKKKGKQKYF